MTDPFAEGITHESGEGAPFVIRLSRNASGARTYTVGATLGRDETPEAVVEALFAIERMVAAGMEGKVEKAAREVPLTAQLRRSIIVSALQKGAGVIDAEGTIGGVWMTTGEIVKAIPGAHRSQVVTDLKALTEQGIVEYERGKGGNYPSRYRLATQKGAKA